MKYIILDYDYLRISFDNMIYCYTKMALVQSSIIIELIIIHSLYILIFIDHHFDSFYYGI